jgi:hypothetical protein
MKYKEILYEDPIFHAAFYTGYGRCTGGTGGNVLKSAKRKYFTTSCLSGTPCALPYAPCFVYLVGRDGIEPSTY